MIKPDGVQRGLVGDIVGRFEKRGYQVTHPHHHTPPIRARLPIGYTARSSRPSSSTARPSRSCARTTPTWSSGPSSRSYSSTCSPGPSRAWWCVNTHSASARRERHTTARAHTHRGMTPPRGAVGRRERGEDGPSDARRDEPAGVAARHDPRRLQHRHRKVTAHARHAHLPRATRRAFPRVTLGTSATAPTPSRTPRRRSSCGSATTRSSIGTTTRTTGSTSKCPIATRVAMQYVPNGRLRGRGRRWYI